MKYTLLLSTLAYVSANYNYNVQIPEPQTIHSSQDYTCLKKCNMLNGRAACIQECEAKRREERENKEKSSNQES